jgi:alpha-galactosidase
MKTVWLSDLDLTQVRQAFADARKDRSIEDKPLSIGGKSFERGIGTHAESYFDLALKEGAERFIAWVGIHDEVGKEGSVEFQVYGDSNLLWKSGLMRGGDAPEAVDVPISGCKRLLLMVTDGGDGYAYDHAVWAEARVVVSGDTLAVTTAPPEEAVILTPKPGPGPKINGARVFGVRPGSPFLFRVPTTGNRPMTFSAKDLPKGLKLDPETGQITGVVNERGEYKVTLSAKNSIGEATSVFRIVVGDRIALTPPMGWNSWNCWGCDANDERVRAIAEAYVKFDLINHGWTYVNMDDGWQGREEHPDGGPGRYPPTYALQADKQKFPDMKKLCDDVHAMGLKIGLYSTSWKFSYGNYTGGSADDEKGNRDNQKVVGRVTFEKQDANQWAEWGIDYMKYDWAPIDVENTRRMSEALNGCGRDIVYSLSNGASFNRAKDWAELSNLWRTTGDIGDNWNSVAGIGFSQDRWKEFAGPGHWNDPDMLVVGYVGWGNPRPTRLSPNEQYSHVSLWCLLSAPLLLGCDLSKADDFLVNLLSNDEVLEVNQDPLGKQAGRVSSVDGLEVWAKDMEDGSKAVGLFNTGLSEAKVTAKWSDLGIKGPQRVRDLWRQKDLSVFDDLFEATVPRHGVMLVRLWAVEKGR